MKVKTTCFDLVVKHDSISAAVIIKGKISESPRASSQYRECARALQQIEENSYDSKLEEDYDTVRKFGIVFFKKTCVIMKKS